MHPRNRVATLAAFPFNKSRGAVSHALLAGSLLVPGLFAVHAAHAANPEPAAPAKAAPAAPRSEPTETAPRPGALAPDFTLPDAAGKSHALSGYRGRWVVLEWVNYDCPFVKKHYGSGNMQKAQKMARGKGVVWLSINSSAPGMQGHFAGTELTRRIVDSRADVDGYLLDSDGIVGRAYKAKTTPHMFVIDPRGMVVYAGAIDDKPSADKADIAAAKNYVQAALEAGMAGKPVATASSTPYGCGVKYAQ